MDQKLGLKWGLECPKLAFTTMVGAFMGYGGMQRGGMAEIISIFLQKA